MVLASMISWHWCCDMRSCQGTHLMAPLAAPGLKNWCTMLSNLMLGMLSLSNSSSGYFPLKESTMRCTASVSSLGGACSAHALGAAAVVATDDADEGDVLSRDCVSALHLSRALRSRATGVQCSGSVTLRASHNVCGCFAMKSLRSAVLLYAYAKSAVVSARSANSSPVLCCKSSARTTCS